MSTADHLKRMAAATHVEISQQGNPVPVLRLEIRYGDSHVRTRALDEHCRYTDSIGANDLTEAVLLIGQVVRFGETMHARRLRKQPPSAAAEPARILRLDDGQIEAIKTSLHYSAQRIRDTYDQHEDPAAAAARRREHEAMFASISAALGAAKSG